MHEEGLFVFQPQKVLFKVKPHSVIKGNLVFFFLLDCPDSFRLRVVLLHGLRADVALRAVAGKQLPVKFML